MRTPTLKGHAMEKNIATKRLVELAHTVEREHQELTDLSQKTLTDKKENCSQKELAALQEILTLIQKRADRASKEYDEIVLLSEKAWRMGKITRIK